MELRTAYGLFEGRESSGNGFLPIIDLVRQKYPWIKTPIHQENDDILGAVRQSIAAGEGGGPNIWLGHSFGVAEMVRTARKLARDGYIIHHFILVDGVTDIFRLQFKFNNWRLPMDVVLKATCFYQKNQCYPDSSILLDADDVLLTNVDLTGLGVDHCTICASDRVSAAVLGSVANFARIARAA